ncbi:hypothetical protein [Cupriavidus sp. D39]|uniref:hypothetical protein n=1 Tax=Cupriavidus sp. D39 TaxID=2997877 RepID=UPI0022712891|nr:hypothetical protein [Cupriavidus sp. D39]MCY0856650.1 hypothetical protein [Cupriavidus sp. D39]
MAKALGVTKTITEVRMETSEDAEEDGEIGNLSIVRGRRLPGIIGWLVAWHRLQKHPEKFLFAILEYPVGACIFLEMADGDPTSGVCTLLDKCVEVRPFPKWIAVDRDLGLHADALHAWAEQNGVSLREPRSARWKEAGLRSLLEISVLLGASSVPDDAALRKVRQKACKLH